jgi:hypothetical protein
MMFEMNEKDKHNNLKYIPMIESGSNLFTGIPCPTAESYNLLGEEGISTIKQKIKTILQQKKENISQINEPYGFPSLILFKDIQSDIIFKVGLTLQEALKKPALRYKHLKKFDFKLYQEKLKEDTPELIIPEEYKVNYHQLLNETDHYLIRKFIDDDTGVFDKNISETL